jgi:hypothetical protein
MELFGANSTGGLLGEGEYELSLSKLLPSVAEAMAELTLGCSEASVEMVSSDAEVSEADVSEANADVSVLL